MAEGMFAIAVVMLVGWGWLETARARDLARRLARRLCKEAGVQLLDETVALRRTFLRRQGGRFSIGRQFRFEFSEGGVDRRSGELTLIGGRMETAVLDGERIGRTIIPN